MTLRGMSKKVYTLWRDGWDIRINHKRRYAYLSKGGEFRAIRYRDALKAIAARDAERRRRQYPVAKRIWTP